MGKIIFVTGGQRSGKSVFAENYCAGYKSVAYIATGVALDAEMTARIEAHRARRSALWQTIEAPTAAAEAIQGALADCVLLDSVTSLVTNLMYEQPLDDAPTTERVAQLTARVDAQISAVINAAAASSAALVAVSDEVGLGLISPYAQGRLFCDLLGRANQALAAASDEAYFLVSGLPLTLKPGNRNCKAI